MADTKRVAYRIKLEPPYDGQIKDRGRFLRMLNLVFSLAFLIAAPVTFFRYWGFLFGYEIFGSLVGLGVGGMLEAWLVPRWMFIYNPEWTGYVTQNVFTGTMVPYGPGLHPSYWWEERNKSGNYSLGVITRDFKAAIATKTAKVIISGKYEYAINLAMITKAIGIDATTIEIGITAFIDSFLTSECAEEDAGKVRGMIDKLNIDLAREFTDNAADFGDKYGFITVSVIIDNITLSDAAQKTRDAVDEASVLHSIVANLYGMKPGELADKLNSEKISVKDYNTMLNRAMATSDNAKMNINVIEADIPAIVGKVVDQLTKGGKP